MMQMIRSQSLWVTRSVLLLPIALLLILLGYFGPWIPHRVSGLVITGLDLAEYVKFLPVVRSGQVAIWREGFYLPLVAVSLAASFAAFQQARWWRWPLRLLLLTIATVAALNLLPPAWDQSTFSNPEFRLQIGTMGICLGLIVFSPLTALLPRIVPIGIVSLVGIAALWFPAHGFLQILPTIRELYQQPFALGWGLYLTVIGTILLLFYHWILLWNSDS